MRTDIVPLGIVVAMTAASASSTAYAQRANDEAPSTASRWPATETTANRMTLGLNGAPLVNHFGFHLGYDRAMLGWKFGEITAGAQFATHFYLPQSSPQRGVAYETHDTSLRLHATAGHFFTLASRRIRIGTQLFLGPSLRIEDSSLRDPAHGIDASYKNVEPLFEAGTALVMGWRMRENFGVNMSLALPLWVSGGASNVLASWLVAPPFLGASGTAYF